MQIYLIRHGETDYNKSRRIQGQCDIELNNCGRELAKITAQALKDVPFDLVFTSPLKRAKETAEIIVGDRQIPVIEDVRIREISFGEYEGLCCDPRNYNIPDKDFLNFFIALYKSMYSILCSSEISLLVNKLSLLNVSSNSLPSSLHLLL